VLNAREMRSLSTTSTIAHPYRTLFGNLVKSCHPRNVGLLKFTKQLRETAVGERYKFMKKDEEESSVEFRMFRRFVVVNMKIMAE
jgi:hypothetical protein